MGVSVLLVEDSRPIRALVTHTLEEFDNLTLSDAVNGLDAIKALSGAQFDLLITDINLPGVTGLELIRFARAHPTHRQMPILIISTQKSEADIERGLSLGANAYLGKPFEPEQLKDAVLPLLPALSQGLS